MIFFFRLKLAVNFPLSLRLFSFILVDEAVDSFIYVTFLFGNFLTDKENFGNEKANNPLSTQTKCEENVYLFLTFNVLDHYFATIHFTTFAKHVRLIDVID